MGWLAPSIKGRIVYAKPVVDVRLEPEREASLWDAFRTHGDMAARQTLIEAYMSFARILSAKTFRGRSHDEFEFDEYFQMATVGLIEAVDRFDPAKGAQFRTYAAHRIQGSILNGLERLSERQQQVTARRSLLADRVAHSKDALRGAGDADATMRALAEIGVGLALGYMLEGSAMLESEELSVPEQGYARVELKQLRARVHAVVDGLPDRERKLIAAHYFQGIPFEEIASEYGVTKGRMSQLHRQALERLREHLGADRLCELSF